MSTYSSQQILAVLNSPNEFPPKLVTDMLLADCFTVDELKAHGLSAHQATLLETAISAQNETKYYERCCKPEATYEDIAYFTTHYPNSVHFLEIRNKQDIMDRDKNVFTDLQQSLQEPNMPHEEKLQKINTFITDNPFNSFVGNARQLAEQLQEELNQRQAAAARQEAERVALEEQRRQEAEREKEDEDEWQRIMSYISNPNYTENVQMKLRLLDDYEQKYTKHRAEIPLKRQEIEEDINAMPRIQSILNDPSSDVIDFIHLIERYPLKKQFLCDFMIQDMRNNPSRYDRVEMNWLLKGKFDDVDNIPPVFTLEELLAQQVAPLNILNHITRHETDEKDRDPQENQLMPETNFKSEKNNTDVYFFGVPGSGKSAVLAGLFKVSTCDNLRFKLLMHGGHLGYTYASILSNYLTNNLFPQSTKTRFVAKQELAPVNPEENPFDTPEQEDDNFTDNINQGEEINSDKFIQIIDAELIEKNKKDNTEEKHKISIIEMPGERTLDFAAATVHDPKDMDRLLGEGTRKLFMNENRKVFFIVIDPKPNRTYFVKANGMETKVTQSGALQALVQFFSEVPGLLEKVDAIHVILTKSDMLRNANDIECIRRDVLDGYTGIIQDIQALCNPSRSNINAQCNHEPHLFTFSLGQVYPGHMLNYKDDDAKKVLQLIAANTYSVKTTPSKWETIVEWMNK